MMTVDIARGGDTREVIQFARKAETQRDTYEVIGIVFKDGDGNKLVNRRLIRQAIFADEYSVFICKDDEREVDGLAITLKDDHSPFVSQALIMLIYRKVNCEWFRKDAFTKKAASLLPEKVRLASEVDISEKLSPLGFSLEGRISIDDKPLFFFSKKFNCCQEQEICYG